MGCQGGSDPVSPDSSEGEKGLRWRQEEGLLPCSAPTVLGRSGAAPHTNAGLTETQGRRISWRKKISERDRKNCFFFLYTAFAEASTFRFKEKKGCPIDRLTVPGPRVET